MYSNGHGFAMLMAARVADQQALCCKHWELCRIKPCCFVSAPETLHISLGKGPPSSAFVGCMQVHAPQVPPASMLVAAAAPPLRLAAPQLNPQGLQRAHCLPQARPRLHPTPIHPHRHPLALLEARHHLRATHPPAQVSSASHISMTCSTEVGPTAKATEVSQTLLCLLLASRWCFLLYAQGNSMQACHTKGLCCTAYG